MFWVLGFGPFFRLPEHPRLGGRDSSNLVRPRGRGADVPGPRTGRVLHVARQLGDPRLDARDAGLDG